MDIEQFRDHCISKPGVTEETPFGPDTLVFKVCGKMFALCGFDFPSFNVKCNPDKAIKLREQYPEVKPGYHMNKKHWNTVILDASIPKGEIERMIDHSYGLVVKGLTKVLRNQLELQYPKSSLYR